jgi:methylmalonyl-CoA mutase cobalamin-binding subunit
MTEPGHDVRDGDTVAMLAAVGITVTEEGKARARAELAEAAAQRTPERRAAWREQLGRPAAAA